MTMKNKLIFFSLFISFIFYSCDNYVTEINIPYQENLVIQGVLDAGQPIKNIRITRTLPPLGDFTIEQSIIEDAIVKINSSNNEYILHYVGNGYYDSDNIIAIPGNEYLISASWHNKRVSGKTIVPFPAQIETIICDSIYTTEGHQTNLGLYYKIKFLSEPYLTYIAGNIYKEYDYYLKDTLTNCSYQEEIVGNNSSEQKSILTAYILRCFTISGYKPHCSKFGNVFVFLETYDPQFYNFWKTKGIGEIHDFMDIFTLSSGKNISWNVSGDGFGLFIGRAQTRMKLW
jgi:hypothetical protein